MKKILTSYTLFLFSIVALAQESKPSTLSPITYKIDYAPFEDGRQQGWIEASLTTLALCLVIATFLFLHFKRQHKELLSKTDFTISVKALNKQIEALKQSNMSRNTHEEKLKLKLQQLQALLETQKTNSENHTKNTQKLNNALIELKKQNNFLLQEKAEVFHKLENNTEITEVYSMGVKGEIIQINTWIKRTARAETELVLNELLEYVSKRKDKEQLHDVVQISSRFKNMKNKINRGLLNDDDSLIETGRINKSIISFLLDLQENMTKV